jgi:tetratricopeptide (TPR) repeat protein
MTARNAARVAASSCIGAVFLLCFLAVQASAQGGRSSSPPPGSTATTTLYQVQSDEKLVRVFAYAEDGKAHLDRQSVIKITDLSTHSVKWQATDEKSEAALGLPFGNYEIEISAVGYLSERKEFQVNTQHITIRIEFALRRDPSAVDFEIADAALPPKARGDVKHAVSALKSANLKEAKKRLYAAYKLAPSNPDLNYLMGYLFFEQRDLAQAASYLTTAANFSSRNVRVLTLLGHVQLMQENYVAAAATLEKAVAVNSEYWTAHNLLANAYLRLRKYEGAREEAELAIAEGKAGAGATNLVLGQSLLNLGKKEEGIRALKAFVQNSRSDPAVPQVRDLIAKLEQHDAGPLPSTEIVQKSETPSSDIDSLYAAPELPVSVNPWRPPGVDEAKPSVTDGVGCPFDTVIEMSGQRVKDLVDNVSRIAAIEGLVHEQVNEMGNPASKENRTYDYVATISEDKLGGFAVNEHRSERKTDADFPDGIASNGFAVLALIFHPSMRENFDMICEGLGRWYGRATWLVHFKQREDRPARMQDFILNDVAFSVHLKGRAWITADKFDIVRIETELIGPMRQIRLRWQQQVVEYGPVQFPRKNLELWLPKQAELYFDFRNHRYYRSHTYDHYMLFSVDSEEKRKEPTISLTAPPVPPPSN